MRICRHVAPPDRDGTALGVTVTERIAVVGGGIAGASAAYFLVEAAPDSEVVLLEAEEHLAMHTTGRSAALLLENDGTRSIRSLVRASVDFLRGPPEELVDAPVVVPREVMHVGGPDQGGSIDRLLAENASGAIPTIEISADEARSRFPALRPEAVNRVALDTGAADIDVHGLHQAYLRGLRRAGGRVAASHRVDAAVSDGDGWRLETTGGNLTADVLVNTAGAWGDLVARRAGIPAVGLEPRRRTAFNVTGPGPEVAGWAMVADVDMRFYVKPDGTQLLCSLAEENPSEPCDARPEETDVALAIDRINAATTLGIRAVNSTWTGLRTFVPDRSMVIGPEPGRPSFVWCVGQGGTGIMTSPGAGRLVADLVLRGEPSGHFDDTGLVLDDVLPDRFRSST